MTYDLEKDLLALLTEVVQDQQITDEVAETVILELEAMLRFNEPFEI